MPLDTIPETPPLPVLSCEPCRDGKGTGRGQHWWDPTEAQVLRLWKTSVSKLD